MKNFTHNGVLLLIGLIIISPSFSQTFIPFQKYFGDTERDVAYSIERLTDTSFLVGGTTKLNSATPADGLVFEVNLSGDVRNLHRIDQGNREDTRRAIPLPGGNMIAIGNTTDAGIGVNRDDLGMVKFDNSGTVINSQFLGNRTDDDQLHLGMLTRDNHVLIGGVSADGPSVAKGIISKMDTSGNVVWAVEASTGPDRDDCQAATEANRGYYVVGGSNYRSGSDRNPSLYYVDQSGNLIFSKVYNDGSSNNNSAYSYRRAVQHINDNSILFAEGISRGGSDYDILLINVDSTGAVKWAKAYGNNGVQAPNFIRKANDGNILVGGLTGTTSGGLELDALVFKIDTAGSVIWARAYGNEGDESVNDAIGFGGTINGGYIIVGETSSFNTNSSMDVYLLGIREDGSGFSSCYNEEVTLQVEDRTITVEESGSVRDFTNRNTHTSTIASPSFNSNATGCQATTSIEREVLLTSVMVYPNPSSGTLYVKSTNSPISSLSVYDITGRAIVSKKLSSPSPQASINILSKGMYILSIETVEGIVRRKVTIK